MACTFRRRRGGLLPRGPESSGGLVRSALRSGRAWCCRFRLRRVDAGATAGCLPPCGHGSDCEGRARGRVLGAEGGGGAVVRPGGVGKAARRPRKEAALAGEPCAARGSRSRRPWAV